MDPTRLNQAVGSVSAYFGTSKARNLGIVISSHENSHRGEDASFRDEYGDTIYRQKYDRSTSGTIQGIMIMDAENEDTMKRAREAIQVGASFTIPGNRAMRTLQGIPIVDEVTESTTSGDFATLNFTYYVNPNLTQVLTADNSTAIEPVS